MGKKKSEDVNRELDVAREAKTGGGVIESTETSLEEMKAYAQSSNCHQVLQELYEQLIIEQPDDPVEYLIKFLS